MLTPDRVWVSAAELSYETRIRAAIDGDVRAMNERRARRCEEQNQVRYLIGLAGAAQRRHPSHDFFGTLRSSSFAGALLEEQLQALSKDRTRIDSDHPHS